MIDTSVPSRRSRAKFVLFTVVANVTGIGILLGVAEFTARWRVEGSAGAAFASFVQTRSADDSSGEPASWLIFDKDLGYKLNPARPGYNALGISHGELVPGKPPGLFRLIVLGDSVAFEQRDFGFVTRLRERFGSIREGQSEVINAAIPGYTTYQERRLLERDLLPLKPDLVIVQYCLNDNHRFLHELSKSGRWLVTKEAERALEPEGPWPTNLLPSSRLLGLVRLRLLASRPRAPSEFPWETRADFAPAWHDSTWSDAEAHLRVMRDRVRHIGGRFAVVVVPYRPQLEQEFLDRNKAYTLKPQRKLAEICARLDVPLLDLYDALFKHRDRDIFRDDIHLTAEGHQIAADGLQEFLVRTNLVR